jgi:hypothetical protein
LTFHLIVVIPTGYTAFNANPSLLTPGAPTEQSSVAVAFTTTTAAPQNVAALFAFMFAAAMITGFWLAHLQFLLQTIHYSNHL